MVAGSPAKGNFAQFLPHFFLKGCTFGGDFQVKLLSVAGKIFGKLLEDRLKTRLIALPVFADVALFRLVGKVQRLKNAVGTDKQKFSEGTLVETVVMHDVVHDAILRFCRHSEASPE